MTLLSVEGLTLDIGAARLLDGVSFAMAEGETFGLIGESGSGKSLTALAIMGLAPEGARTAGAVALAGRRLDGLSDRALCAVRGADVGMVFQEPMTALNPVRPIGAQVAETVLIHGRAGTRTAERIAAETLARVGLPPERFPLSRYPHELSGGQRQRVVIAMAIALRPKLLIADEPTTALDVTTQAQILRLLKRLAAEDGMGLMLITHDLGVVADMADRVVVMREGRVVEAGPAERVLRAPSHGYTRALAAAARHAPLRAAPPAGGEAVLSVRDVVRDYALPRARPFGPRPLFRAVDGVSFEVRRGETVALVGESGCGKSTLTRAILGLEETQAGRIAVCGAPIEGRRTTRAVRRRVQVVFQDPYGSFDPRWKAGDLIAEPFHLLDEPPKGAARREKIATALAAVGLKPADADKYPHEFSGGQRQRLAIARALIIDPDLIVLDEATSALDVRVRAQVLDLLAGLSARLGLSYLFIAHDLGVVRAVADRVLVMQGGRIVEEGPTARVFDAPGHPYTATLLAASPDLDRALARRAARSVA
ncbi:MAG: ABC transporter ATP-binding protein [Rhodobacteraceae bacterium]|nr:MAG: ABC transporter ATP-binding protein [Paracoccaceae bacterium]